MQMKLDRLNSLFNCVVMQMMKQFTAGNDFSEAAMRQAESIEIRMRDAPPREPIEQEREQNEHV
jgi:hypothetical protein